MKSKTEDPNCQLRRLCSFSPSVLVFSFHHSLYKFGSRQFLQPIFSLISAPELFITRLLQKLGREIKNLSEIRNFSLAAPNFDAPRICLSFLICKTNLREDGISPFCNGAELRWAPAGGVFLVALLAGVYCLLSFELILRQGFWKFICWSELVVG